MSNNIISEATFIRRQSTTQGDKGHYFDFSLVSKESMDSFHQILSLSIKYFAAFWKEDSCFTKRTHFGALRFFGLKNAFNIQHTDRTGKLDTYSLSS